MTIRRSHKPFWRTRTLRYTLIITSAIAGVLLFVLASASANTPLFERVYPILLALNATIALMMVTLVGVLVWRLTKRYRKGAFGARLMVRFALSFALMGVIPGVVIYLVSVQFLSRSIESWFDVRVDNALESGLALGHTVLDSMLSDVNGKARIMALELSEVPESQMGARLGKLREQAGVQEALIFTTSGRLIASAGGSLQTLVPDMPSARLLSQLRVTRGYAATESPLSDPDNNRPNLSLRAVVAITSSNLTMVQSDAPQLFLQLMQPVPPAIAANANEVESGVRDYQELSLSRAGLKRIYTVTLTLALLLSAFAALASAFLLATWLTAPLLLLAEGTKAVAGGDFRPMQEINTNDELGTLTQSFNAMTRQLGEARGAVERNRVQLENANTYLQSILTNLSAGVLVFDENFTLVTANQSAGQILGTTLTRMLGEPASALAGMGDLAEAVVRAFDEQAASGRDWQQQIELTRPAADGEGGEPVAVTDRRPDDRLTLLARGSRCPVGDGQGYLVVFDDISNVISAQRSVAWAEVARRLAHEIKNPLTPIQLSAERLQMKLQDKLSATYAEVLERGVQTIVNQVSAMKRMVDDFRDYARVPSSNMGAVDLNALIAEVLTLYGAEGADVSENIRLALAPGLPLIQGDAMRLRQVIHNLVQNAQDATQEQAVPRIVVATEKVEGRPNAPASGGREAMVRLTVSDNGSGFPARILARAFEPYVTTKSRGTGLGLAVVKKIADEHEARIRLRNEEEGGASVSILFTRVAGRQLAVA